MKISGYVLILSVMAISACIRDADPDGEADPVQGSVTPVIDGRYDLDAARCRDANSQTRLTVRGDSFDFYESSCTFGRKGGQSGASEGVLICMGEGRRFTRDVRLESRANGLTIHENGTALTYDRCPAA